MKKVILLLLMIQSLISCVEKRNSSEASKVSEDAVPVLESAKKITSAHTSENSLDWAGTYSGVLPCKDCDGIDVTLSLNKDKTFQQNLRYINSSEEKIKNLEGNFSWSAKADKIILVGVKDFAEFKVVELFLVPLDKEGKEIKPVPGNNFQLLKE